MTRRFLFCLPTSALSGGVKVIHELADRLVAGGDDVDLFSYAGPPDWRRPRATFLPARDLDDVDLPAYDVVVAGNAFFLPLLLPRVGSARCVLLAQDYESFHHADGDAYADYMAETPAMAALYRLPVPIVTTSRPLVRVIAERTGRVPHYMPVGIDKSVFTEQPRRARPAGARHRVLLVGNYLMPYKGMKDARDALAQLDEELPVELVVVTQEQRGRAFFDACPYPVELHFCPADEDVPGIVASCDALCCASWYEGLGLPAAEAFHCGTPVVSTRTLGVGEYAHDGVNLLLAEPADPADLAAKLRRVLTDAQLAERLRSGGLRTAAAGFDWRESARCFLAAIDAIERTYEAPEVDAAALARMLRDLEDAGCHTPIWVYRRFEALAAGLARVEERLRDGATPAAADVEALRAVRDGLAAHLGNPRAQYHAAFRGAYDRCSLLLELAGSPETRAYLPLVIDRARERRGSDAPALTERRYTYA